MIFRKPLHKTFRCCFLFITLGLGQQLYGAVEVNIGMNTGNAFTKELSGGSEYNNQSTFFVGHFGYTLGTKLKLQLGQIGFGVVGEIAWIGDSLERKSPGENSGTPFRNEFNRGLAGATLAIHTGSGSSCVFVEYYPWVENTVMYSDKKDINPYRKGDKINANGYGLGFNFGLTADSSYQLSYKKLKYKSAVISGTKVTYPNDQYQQPNVDEITMGFVMRF